MYANIDGYKIEDYTKQFINKKEIKMTKIITSDFSLVYNTLLERKATYNPKLVKQLKKELYELVITNEPAEKFKVLNIEDDELETSEVVVAITVDKRNQVPPKARGYNMPKVEEIFLDIFLNNGNFLINDLVEHTLIERLKNTGGSLPIYKYIADYDNTLPEAFTKYVKYNYDDFLSASIRKEKSKSNLGYESIQEIWNSDMQIEKKIRCVPLIDEENIVLDELYSFLINCYNEDNNILKNPKCSSDFKRVIKIYDFLKYGNKYFEYKKSTP